MESREEQYRADVRITQHIWSPRLEVDRAPISWGTSVHEFQKGRAGHIAEALDQALLLPRTWTAIGVSNKTTSSCL